MDKIKIEFNSENACILLDAIQDKINSMKCELRNCMNGITLDMINITQIVNDINVMVGIYDQIDNTLLQLSYVCDDI